MFLKIARASSQEEVESAYTLFREKIEAFAPGIKIGEADLEKEFPDVIEAFKLLRDPALRAEYDKLTFYSDTRTGVLPAGTIDLIEEKLTLRQWFSQAATYAAFICLMVMVIIFLYMLADYKL